MAATHVGSMIDLVDGVVTLDSFPPGPDDWAEPA